MTTDVQMQLDVPQLVLEASDRCKDYLSPTPLERSTTTTGLSSLITPSRSRPYCSL